LESIANNEEAIRKKIDESNDLVWRQRATPTADYNPAVIIEAAFNDAKAINYTYGIARSTLSMGMGAFIITHDSALSLKLITEAYQMFKTLNDKEWMSNSLLTQAIVTNSLGNHEDALYYAIKGIEFYENDHHPGLQEVAMAYYVTGTVYKDLKKFDQAEYYFLKGIENEEERSSWVGRIFTGLSNIYNVREKYQEALDLSFRSLAILKEENNIIGISRALNDIGIIYRKLKQYDKALPHFYEALELRKEANVPHFVLGSLIDIADTHVESGDLKKGLEYYLKAQPLAEETAHSARLATIFLSVANLYKLLNKYEESILHFQKHIKLISEINVKEKEIKITDLQNSILAEKEQEIERLKNVELKNAYDLITEKNKEIMDSIHYAKRIQNALLASEKLLEENLKEQFVLFKPKDIVSGDFYWATKVTSSKFKVSGSGGNTQNPKPATLNSELFYLAVCDSTGHGVPGAFMSLLNITFLNEAIVEKGIYEPHLILNYVRERLISAISQDGAQDGMDGILICYDKQNGTLTYSAANNAPILVSGNKIQNLAYDKMPVGKGLETTSFKLHKIDVKSSDSVYLITDGYADQFGGTKGKKFKHKNLVELIQSYAELPLSEQKDQLDSYFENWKGDLEQVDDVCIIGIRL